MGNFEFGYGTKPDPRMRGLGRPIDNLEGAAAPMVVEPVAGSDPASQYVDDLLERADAIRASNPNMTSEEAVTLASRAGIDARRAERAASMEADLPDAMSLGDAMEESYGNPVVRNPAGSTVPGRRDPFTNRASPPTILATPEDVDAYEFRMPSDQATAEQLRAEAMMGDQASPYRGGAMLPSQEDRDMWERGLVRTVNPTTGESSYKLAATGSAKDAIPGAAGRRGYRADLSGKYEAERRESPFGRQEVLVPTQAFRGQMDAREDAQRLERQADRAGISYDDAVALLTEGRTADDIIRMGNARLRDEKRGRQAEVVRQAQLRSNPTALLSPEMREFVIAQNVVRDPRLAGASPFDVRKAEAEADSMMQSRLGLSRGPQVGPVQEQVAANAKLNSRLEMIKAADDYVATNFAWKNEGLSGFWASGFTPREQRATVEWLKSTYGVSDQEAESIVASIAATRLPPNEQERAEESRLPGISPGT